VDKHARPPHDALRRIDTVTVRLDRRAFALGLPLAAALPSTARAQVAGQVEVVESQYSTIYVSREGQLYSMVFGINQRLFTESQYDAANPRSLPVTYTRYMTNAVAYPAQVNSILEIGLGGGTTALYLHQHMPNAQITCVEIDKAVIALAKKYFGFKEDARLRAVEQDGRRFFTRDRGRYDIVMIDAYRGTFVPFHLLTREYLTIVKSRLNPGGVVAQNIEPCTMLYPAAVNTLRAVFANVELYEAAGNVVAIAYDGPEKTRAELGARAAALQRTHRFTHPLPDLMRGRQIVRGDMPGGRVLVDDFAPAEALAGTARGNDRNQQSRTGLCPR
jgi:spermidine synthase